MVEATEIHSSDTPRAALSSSRSPGYRSPRLTALSWLAAAYFAASSLVAIGPADSYWVVNGLKGIGILALGVLATLAGRPKLRHTSLALLILLAVGTFGASTLLFRGEADSWWRSFLVLSVPCAFILAGVRLTGTPFWRPLVRRTLLAMTALALAVIAAGTVELSSSSHIPGVFRVGDLFTVNRSGWSTSAAIVVIGALGSYRAPGIWRQAYSPLAATLPILLSQAVVGGRAGMVASVVGGFILSVTRRDWKIALLIVAGLSAGVGAVAGVSDESTLAVLRADTNAPSIVESIDEIGSGRLQLATDGYARLLESSLLGGGESNAVVRGHTVHIVWIALLLQAGVLYLASAIGILIVAVRPPSIRESRMLRGSSVSNNGLRVSLLIGVLILSFLTPTVPFGTGNGSAIFWFLSGASKVD